MPNSVNERKKSERGTIPEVIRHICSADGCDQEDARQELRKALTDGAVGVLWWRDSPPMDPGTGVPDIPPSRHPHWADAEIDWETGTVRDDWGIDARHRVILIRWAPVRKYWPEMHPIAQPSDGQDEEADPAEWERYEAQRARLARKAREEREAYDAAWNVAWGAECAKGVGQRRFFRFGELASGLARNPRTLVVDDPLRDRILSDLESWYRDRRFADGEVVWLGGDPPTFTPVAPLSAGTFLASVERTMLCRDATRRYIEVKIDLPGAPGLLLSWFSANSLKQAEESTSSPAVDEVMAPAPAEDAGTRTAEPIIPQAPAEVSNVEEAWSADHSRSAAPPLMPRQLRTQKKREMYDTWADLAIEYGLKEDRPDRRRELISKKIASDPRAKDPDNGRLPAPSSVRRRLDKHHPGWAEKSWAEKSSKNSCSSQAIGM